TDAGVVAVAAVARRRPREAFVHEELELRRWVHGERRDFAAVSVGVDHEIAVPVVGNLSDPSGPGDLPGEHLLTGLSLHELDRVGEDLLVDLVARTWIGRHYRRRQSG